MRQRSAFETFDLITVAILIVTGLGIGTCLALEACSSTPAPTVAKVDEVAMYAAALQTCVATATTRTVADQCRKDVEYTYCGPNGTLKSSSGCEKDGGAE